LDNAAVIRVLEGYVKEVRDRLAVLETLHSVFPWGEARMRIEREHQFQLLTLDYGLDVHRFQMEWLENAIQQIRAYGDVGLPPEGLRLVR
jgi:hypothetical protein